MYMYKKQANFSHVSEGSIVCAGGLSPQLVLVMVTS